jgi:hypothetical protein
MARRSTPRNGQSSISTSSALASTIPSISSAAREPSDDFDENDPIASENDDNVALLTDDESQAVHQPNAEWKPAPFPVMKGRSTRSSTGAAAQYVPMFNPNEPEGANDLSKFNLVEFIQNLVRELTSTLNQRDRSVQLA